VSAGPRGVRAGPPPLDSAEIAVKLFLEDPQGVRPGEIVPVFHRWIREGALPDELMVDVATYEHVPRGPGVVLICDTAHYAFDLRFGRPGLRWRGRRVATGTGRERLGRAFRSALTAAALLERETALEGRCRFRTDELEVGIHDRLRAPSDRTTFDLVRPELAACVGDLFRSEAVTLEMTSGARDPFLVSIRTGASASVGELLDRAQALARARSEPLATTPPTARSAAHASGSDGTPAHA